MEKTFHNKLIEYYGNKTVAFLGETPLTIDQCLYIFFTNYRLDSHNNQTGMRLSKYGHKILSKDFDHHKYKFEGTLTPKVLFYFDNNMIWPYYIDRSEIVFYNDSDAAMFLLSGGNINDMAELV